MWHIGVFFSSRRRHTRLQGDWSSDVCSSDLIYLLHYPLFIFWARFIDSGNLFPSNPVARNLLAFGGQILIATVAGSISWYFFEEPILRLKERFPSGSAMHSRTEAEESKPWNRAVVTDSRA